MPGLPDVVTVGECLVALVAAELGPLAEARTYRAYVAGAEANVAVGLVRLGHHVAFIGRVGEDEFGTAAIRRLRGEGVDVSALAVEPGGYTGLIVRERRAVGPTEVVYHRRASAGSRVSPEDVDGAHALGLFGGRWLHVTGITPALSASARAAVQRAIELARSGGLTISLDLNLRRKLWSDAEAAPVLRAIATEVDVVLASTDEAAVVVGRPETDGPATLGRALLDLGPSAAVLKLGSAGGFVMTRDGASAERPAVPVSQVVDPVGAGDAFSAGWIAACLDGETIDSALETANACGAAVVAAEGDMTGLPTRAELDLLRGTRGADVIR